MFLEFLLFTLAGLGLGIFTGLAPGIHVNTISAVSLPLAPLLGPMNISCLIISMAITHTFFDFIPSIFLGAPEPETALGVLPGHRMLLEGRGIEAVFLATEGGLASVLIILLALPAFLFTIPLLYSSVHAYIPYLLIGISAVMIFSEKRPGKILLALFVFLLSGLLGHLVLGYTLLPVSQSLFPIFTGLFGMSTLLLSLSRRSAIPGQSMEPVHTGNRGLLLGSISGIVSGSVMGTLPGIGGSQAATLSQQAFRSDNKTFLVSIGSINTVVAFFSLLSLFTISKARSGAAVAVQAILPSFGMNEMLLLVAVGSISAGLSVIIVLKTMRAIACTFARIDYAKATKAVIAVLFVLVLLLTGPLGILVLITSTFIGLLAPLFGVVRSNLMGVLLLPLIAFYLAV